jgi:hypothetical protein
LFAPPLKLVLAHSSAHEIRDHGAFILIAEGVVEGLFDFIGHTEIDGSHALAPLLKNSTMSVYSVDYLGQGVRVGSNYFFTSPVSDVAVGGIRESYCFPSHSRNELLEKKDL